MEKTLALKLPEYDYASLYPNTKVLSSSQVLTYEKSPAEFYTKYVLGVRGEPSVAMQVGSIFSELHRTRDFDFRGALRQVGAPGHIGDLFDRVIKNFPVIPAEVVLTVYPACFREAGFVDWGVRATLDGYVASQYDIVENKTGQTEWNDERVRFDDQLSFQAWVHWQKYGVLPRHILLNWVNTKARCSKPLSTFKAYRTTKGLKMFQNRVVAVVENIMAENWTQPIYSV